MKLQNVAIATLAALSVAPIAFAGTSVTNSYSTKVTRGTGFQRINVNAYEYKRQYNNSQSIKVETYGGDNNTSIATYKDGKLSGTAISTNRRVVDPVAIISTSSQSEYSYSTERTNVYAGENYGFYGTERSHTVSSDSF